MSEHQAAPADNPKHVAARRRPLSAPAAEMLVTLVDEGMIALTSSQISGGTFIELYKMAEARSVDSKALPFDCNRTAFDALYSRGYVAQVNKDKVEQRLRAIGAAIGKAPPFDMDGGRYLAWYNQPYVVTAAGQKAVAATLREQVADIRRERQAMEENPRYLVAALANYGGHRQPGAGNLYRILRETGGRYYVDSQVVAPGAGVHFSGVADLSCHGTGANSYIERADVVAVDVTLEQHRAMVRATSDYLASVTAAASQMEAEIAPIRRRHADRAKQLAAQLADEMREAAGVVAEPEAPGAGGPRR